MSTTSNESVMSNGKRYLDLLEKMIAFEKKFHAGENTSKLQSMEAFREFLTSGGSVEQNNHRQAVVMSWIVGIASKYPMFREKLDSLILIGSIIAQASGETTELKPVASADVS